MNKKIFVLIIAFFSNNIFAEPVHICYEKVKILKLLADNACRPIPAHPVQGSGQIFKIKDENECNRLTEMVRRTGTDCLTNHYQGVY